MPLTASDLVKNAECLKPCNKQIGIGEGSLAELGHPLHGNNRVGRQMLEQGHRCIPNRGLLPQNLFLVLPEHCVSLRQGQRTSPGRVSQQIAEVEEPALSVSLMPHTLQSAEMLTQILRQQQGGTE